VIDLERRPPAVVAERLHGGFQPTADAPTMPKEDGHRVVAVGEGVDFRDDRIADHSLDRESPAVDLRGDRFDDRASAAVVGDRGERGDRGVGAGPRGADRVPPAGVAGL
jgi:hypothetical protein